MPRPKIDSRSCITFALFCIIVDFGMCVEGNIAQKQVSKPIQATLFYIFIKIQKQHRKSAFNFKISEIHTVILVGSKACCNTEDLPKHLQVVLRAYIMVIYPQPLTNAKLSLLLQDEFDAKRITQPVVSIFAFQMFFACLSKSKRVPPKATSI